MKKRKLKVREMKEEYDEDVMRKRRKERWKKKMMRML